MAREKGFPPRTHWVRHEGEDDLKFVVHDICGQGALTIDAKRTLMTMVYLADSDKYYVPSLDELPNILNVIMGDMSLVGPRPLVDYESELYGQYREKRHSVLPGITGLAQVQGRLDLSLQERLYWDLKYIDNYSFLNDIKIVFKTISSVLRKKGAN